MSVIGLRQISLCQATIAQQILRKINSTLRCYRNEDVMSHLSSKLLEKILIP